MLALSDSFLSSEPPLPSYVFRTISISIHLNQL